MSTEDKDLLLDSDGDIVVTDDLQFVSDVDAIAQECRLRMGAFRGEWFLDLLSGIPYWESILGEKYNEAAMIAIFRAELQEVADVDEIITLTANFDGTTRTMLIAWELRAGDDTITDAMAVEV